MLIWLTVACALLLGIISLIAGKFRFLDAIPRSRWLSLAGGVAVAYVFVHLIPELSHHQETVTGLGYEIRIFSTHTVYLIALLGLAIFYGLERAAKSSRRKQQRIHNEDTASPQVFLLHMISFTIYNAIIGYLLVHREVPGVRSLLLFTLAMGLHFFTNDYGLRQDFKGRYHQYGRWILALAVLLGWAVGILTTLHPLVVPILFAFLSGGVVLNVLKEELPAERQSSFWAFFAGVIGYTLILLVQ
jgi:hypothetical protein